MTDTSAPGRRRGLTWRPPASVRRQIERFDIAVDDLFEPMRGHPVPDRIFEAASHLGDWALIWDMIAVTLAWRSDQDFRRTPRLLAEFGVESLIVNQGIKRLFHRTRPLERPAVAAKLRVPLTTSFPSGHASSAAFATVVLCDRRPGLLGVIAPIAVVVATSRIYNRMHFPSDVAVGAIVGTALGRVAVRINRRLDAR